MTTIGNVIDRIYRDYLTPPGEQPARFQVGAGGIDASSTSLPVDVTMLSAELQDLIGVGTLVEGETGEMFLVETVTGDPPTSLTVRREMYDTDPFALTAGDYLYLAGDDHQPRKAVFDAVADAVTALWPDLYTIDVEDTSGRNGPIELPAAALMVVDVQYQSGGRWLPARTWRELRNFPYVSTERAVQVDEFDGYRLLVYYRKAAVRPTAESDDLADLFVDESWVAVLMVGAVGQLIANKDLDRATINFITEALEAQGFEVGEGADLRNSLLQYQGFLKRPLRARLRLQEEDRIVDRGY